MENTVVISNILCNILVGCFCVLVIIWGAAAVNMIISERKDQKRRDAAEKREIEYHEKRMKDFK